MKVDDPWLGSKEVGSRNRGDVAVTMEGAYSARLYREQVAALMVDPET
jgi:hypothetical protein